MPPKDIERFLDEAKRLLVPGSMVQIKEKYLGEGVPRGMGIIGRKATPEDYTRVALPRGTTFFLVLFPDHLDFFPEIWLWVKKPSRKLNPGTFRSGYRMLFREEDVKNEEGLDSFGFQFRMSP